MPGDDGPEPNELEEEKREATLDEEDLESEEEQTWEDEYEDTEGQSTTPLHHGPGLTVQRYRCGTCGHVAERPVTGTAYDELPPVHHNKYMLHAREEEAKLPLEEFLERVKAREAKRARGRRGRRAAPAKKPARKAKPAKRKARPAKRKPAAKKRRR